MSCLLALLALVTPRIVIVLIVLFSDYIGQAYETVIWPFLGFLFFPLTTLAYAWAMHSKGSVSGFQLAVVVLAVLIDLGIVGGGGRAGRRRKWRRIRRTRDD